MIDKFKLAKALNELASATALAATVDFVNEGESYDPDVNKAYIEEFVLYGSDNVVGLADDSDDIQFGFYQININTPKANTGAKWQGLAIAGNYQLAFKRGVELLNGGQMVRMINSSLVPMDATETHYTHILSIKYSVIG